jgi:outer membrane protein assembly factor BamD
MQKHSFFPNFRSALLAGVAVAGLSMSAGRAMAQDPGTPPPVQPTPTQTTTSPDSKVTTTTSTTVDQTGRMNSSVTSKMTFSRGKKPSGKSEKTVMSTDTKKAVKRDKKADALAGVDSKLPDKALYDKAVYAISKGRFDVARLDLQTMLNTYPDSQYQMRAKLKIADSWYKEGGTAALTQAEQEYSDFRVFFPNAPEAAEAQMRIGDIYFRQMDRPDRDYSKALHAAEEYRRMLTDYPDSTLVPQAKQRLRDVQEVLATRESEIAAYYGTRSNFAASIARYQTVADTYRLYSHMDDVLIGLGDAYEAQARYVRSLPNLPEGAKARLEQLYDGEAADSYRKVVLEHSAAAHVDDAKDRLAVMNVKIPVPTAEQVAASAALENSRSSYRMADRVSLLFLHKPDTVTSAHVNEPTLVDPKATTAPMIVKKANADFAAAFAGTRAPVASPVAVAPVVPAAAVAPSAPAGPAAPLKFEEVPTVGAGGSSGSSVMSAPAASSPGAVNAGVGVEIITHPAAPASDGLKAVGPKDATALPAVEKAAPAPDVLNDVADKSTPAAQAAPADGKKAAKPTLDKKDESSSKTKKKKGLDKLNPF